MSEKKFLDYGSQLKIMEMYNEDIIFLLREKKAKKCLSSGSEIIELFNFKNESQN